LADCRVEHGVFTWTRKKGDALWPQRYDAKTLTQTSLSRGPYWWAAMYQQRPQPLGGGKFKREWFRYYHVSPDGTVIILHEDDGDRLIDVSTCWRFATVDLASSLKTDADFFVISVWFVSPVNDLIWRDCFRARLEGPDQLPQLRSMVEKWRLGYIGIEKTGYQGTLIQSAVRDGLPAKELHPDVDKLTRSLPMQARYAAHKVFHPVGTSWLETAETELLQFPNGAHDDIVDTASYAGIEIVGGSAEPRIRRL